MNKTSKKKRNFGNVIRACEAQVHQLCRLFQTSLKGGFGLRRETERAGWDLSPLLAAIERTWQGPPLLGPGCLLNFSLESL